VDGPNGDVLDLTRALAKLSPAYRQVVILHYLADQSVREIAAFVGVAEGTVKARLHRARAALNELLGVPDKRVNND
jgi:RNA polymerase sigma-70 factor (ECF subfamily)